MTSASIIATAIKANELKPGDLFSARGQDYWATALDNLSIGEAVFIRTNAPSHVAPDEQTVVYKIKIVS